MEKQQKGILVYGNRGYVGNDKILQSNSGSGGSLYPAGMFENEDKEKEDLLDNKESNISGSGGPLFYGPYILND